MKMHVRDSEWVHDGCLCQFGLGEAIAAFAVADLGVGATAATIGADALIGAGVGGIAGEVTTGKPLLGALTGGLTGGAIGAFGGVAGDALGSATAGDALVGAGAGAAGAGLTGQNPLTGAIEGGVGGAVSANIGGAATGAPAASGGSVGGAGASASGIAAPSGVGDALGAGSGVLDAATQGAVPAGIPLGQIDPGAAAQIGAGPSGAGGNLSLAAAASDVPGGGPSATPGSPSAVGDAASGSGAGAGGPVDSGAFDIAGQPPGPGGPAASAGGGGFVDSGRFDVPGSTSGLSGVGNFLGRNANWLLPAATIGYDALKSGQGLGGVPGYNQLNSQAGALGAQSAQLQSYLSNGTLPPGVQTSLDQAGKAAMATIKSQYASRGMSGSSAEAQDLANVHNTIASQGADIATKLLQTGISEAGLSSQLYEQILNSNLQSDNQLGQALGTLAGAAARPTIQVGQSTTTG